jgi:glycosyl-4,4'-diaponeurosporenoate acyltransferase
VIIHLPGIFNIVIDIFAWLLIHVGVSLLVDRMPPYSFHPDSWLYRERRWEKGGSIYQVLLGIKKWKGLLPDGAAILNRFRKKHLVSLDPAYISRFVAETCRAELIHWGIFLCSPLFFIWNEWWIGLIMITYAIIVNVPCIVTQRYNRIKLKRIYVSIVNRQSLK